MGSGWYSFAKLILAIRASGRGAKAAQYGLLGILRGYQALLGRIGKTWLLLSRLYSGLYDKFFRGAFLGASNDDARSGTNL